MAVTCHEGVKSETSTTDRPLRAFFVTWAKLRRADTIGELLGVPSYSVQYLRRGTPVLLTLWKYFLQTVHTLWLCVRHRPRAVLVTNPPVFAILPVWLYSVVFRARFVVDFHSGCFLQKTWRKWDRWQRFFARRAVLNLVHNAENAKVLDSWGVRYKVFPSLPPRLDVQPAARADRSRPLVVYICSFKADEPAEQFLEAAAGFSDIDFSVTGRAPEALREGLPPHVRLTGFLSEADYLELLAGADLIVALTKQSDTLLYGAQEAIALHKPLLLSRTSTLETYFPEGTVFANNTPEELGRAIREALSRKDELASAMAAFEKRYRAEGEERLRELREAIA